MFVILSFGASRETIIFPVGFSLVSHSLTRISYLCIFPNRKIPNYIVRATAQFFPALLFVCFHCFHELLSVLWCSARQNSLADRNNYNKIIIKPLDVGLKVKRANKYRVWVDRQRVREKWSGWGCGKNVLVAMVASRFCSTRGIAEPRRRNLLFFSVSWVSAIVCMRSTLETILRLGFSVCCCFFLCAVCVCRRSWQRFGGPTDEEMRISIYLCFH